jgi:pimeloyl-ACP methyl ester carboxylesterase
MKYFSLLVVFLANVGISSGAEVTEVPPDQDVGKDMVTLVTSRGYTIETHNVTTADGYILTMFRIPSGKNFKLSGSGLGAPVILQHGLLDSSYTWITNFEDESLGYILADKGFDVWFGNNRGNRYGRNHVSKNPDDNASGFWDFTWDDMSSYDVPAMINYVTDLTGYPTVGWVGHSEGTIQMFGAGTSLETNTNDYFQRAMKSINIFAALAPVAYVDNLKTKLLVALAQTDLPQKLIDRGYLEFLPYGPIEAVSHLDKTPLIDPKIPLIDPKMRTNETPFFAHSVFLVRARGVPADREGLRLLPDDAVRPVAEPQHLPHPGLRVGDTGRHVHAQHPALGAGGRHA